MHRQHCIKCASTRLVDGRSRLFIVLGIAVITAGLVAALISMATNSAGGEYGSVSAETTVAGFVICYGFLLLNQGLTRTERVTCKNCGTHFTPPKPRLLQND